MTQATLTQDSPLSEVREYVNSLLWDTDPHIGGQCPACDKPVKRRREVLYGSIVTCLAVIYRLGGTGVPVALEEVRRAQAHYAGLGAMARNDITKGINRLEFFGLARSVGGKWLCTEDGESFLRGTHRVQKVAWTYNEQVIWRDGPLIDVTDVRGLVFNLQAFLRGEL